MIRRALTLRGLTRRRTNVRLCCRYVCVFGAVCSLLLCAPSVVRARCGDFNDDGHVDHIDFAAFFDCLTGPGGEPISPDCFPADFDSDNDVDLYDWRTFQSAFGTDSGILDCDARWVEGFHLPGMDRLVEAFIVFDDGGGPALYAGGSFSLAGATAAQSIAKWDGTSWSPLGSGFGPYSPYSDPPLVSTMAVFDDGTGPALYVGGMFQKAGGLPANNIARWDGSRWSALGQGTNGHVQALAVFDDGSGPALYAGGGFDAVGGAAANSIAKWDGNTWSPVGGGVESGVSALAVFDDGTGPALYAGGNFTLAGGVEAHKVAKWDGSSWSALGSGMNREVAALTVFDDGGGPALYAAGYFTMADDAEANYIARWDGSSWSPVGGGTEGYFGVFALTVFDDGSGPALYAAGSFTSAGGAVVNGIAKWDGVSWSPLGSGIDAGFSGWPWVRALIAFDDGSGPGLYVGGMFATAGEVRARNIARWNGVTWSSLEGIPGAGIYGSVDAFTVYDDGNGPGLYAGGGFGKVGETAANNIARLDGSAWSALGDGTNGRVRSLAVFDDGSGTALYAGGEFTVASDLSAARIARWDGDAWSPLGSGIGNGKVWAMTAFDDGTGPGLYVGGEFTIAGDGPANHIARWDSSSWSPVGDGVDESGMVLALAVFDDGSGPALYAGGQFVSAGGVTAANIAKWDGTNWSPLASGVGGSVYTLAVFDDGTGPALYVGGFFQSAGGVLADDIAKWDGTSWSALRSGVNPAVEALAGFDDGSGPTLFVGDDFTHAGSTVALSIARWDGCSWWPVGRGMDQLGAVKALAVFDDGSGPALYAGGSFTSAGGVPSLGVARWYRPVSPCPESP